MNTKSQSTLDALRLAVHGVAAPFVCEGTYDTEAPVTIVFRDKTRFEVVPAENDFEQAKSMEPLLLKCKPAKFGEGKKTRFDRSVRDALQLEAKGGGFSVENFDPEESGILEAVQRGLVPHDPNPISAELYTVNVYQRGGHFEPHKDTPRGEDMFGTLVVCLPSQFWRGDFVLSHRGIVHKIDWGSMRRQQKNPNQVQWAAFFGDVDHQIKQIYGGVRVTLTYLLRRGNGASLERHICAENLAPRIQEALQALLADKTFLPDGGTLGYPCCHLYHQDARFQKKQRPIGPRSVSKLKGRDHLFAATALKAGLEVQFSPYMFENCVDETWQLTRFPTKKEIGGLGSQMGGIDLERTLPIGSESEEGAGFGVTWLEEPPSLDRTTWQSDESSDSELPAAARLHSCEYCPWGYFGNESSFVDFYTYAALHLAIPKYGEGVRNAGSEAKATPSKRTAKKPAGKPKTKREGKPKED